MSTISPLPLERAASGQSHSGIARPAAPTVPARFAAALTLLGADAAGLLGAIACSSVLCRLFGLDGATHGEFMAAAAGLFLYLVAHAHYTRRVPFWTEAQDVVYASAGALVFGLCLDLAGAAGVVSVSAVLVWLLFPVLALVARRAVRARMLAAGLWQIRTLLVATQDNAANAIAALRSEPGLGYDIVGLIDPAQLGQRLPDAGWGTLLAQYDARLLVLGFDGTGGLGRRTIEALVRGRVPFAVMQQLDGLPAMGSEQTRFFSHDTVMMSYRNNLARPMTRMAKMVFDVVMAASGLVLLAPLLLVIAALVRLDGGPALFGHTRIGAAGRSFRVLKFRSMVTNSDAVLRDLLAKDPRAALEWRQTHKLRNDPRITPIGRFLRSTSLDELPQLINVLRLEMSLVGPRPIVQAEIARYGDDIAFYYETRPGLTGLWQVSGRTETSYAHRVQLDTWYVKNWTIWHDLAIIAKTVPAVLQRRGAC